MPRKPSNTVESLKAASARSGIGVELLRAARTAGCEAFKGSRVNLDMLKEWLDENSDVLASSDAEGSEDLLTLKRNLIRQQILRATEMTRATRLSNEETERKLIRIDLVIETNNALVSELNGEIRKIEDGLPQALLGLSLPEQRVRIREFFDAMRAKIHRGTP
jgi:hypothetical protein